MIILMYNSILQEISEKLGLSETRYFHWKTQDGKNAVKAYLSLFLCAKVTLNMTSLFVHLT